MAGPSARKVAPGRRPAEGGSRITFRVRNLAQTLDSRDDPTAAPQRGELRLADLAGTSPSSGSISRSKLRGPTAEGAHVCEMSADCAKAPSRGHHVPKTSTTARGWEEITSIRGAPHLCFHATRHAYIPATASWASKSRAIRSYASAAAPDRLNEQVGGYRSNPAHAGGVVVIEAPICARERGVKKPGAAPHSAIRGIFPSARSARIPRPDAAA